MWATHGTDASATGACTTTSRITFSTSVFAFAGLSKMRENLQNTNTYRIIEETKKSIPPKEEQNKINFEFLKKHPIKWEKVMDV